MDRRSGALLLVGLSVAVGCPRSLKKGATLVVIADRDARGFDCKRDRAKHYGADGKEAKF